MWQSITFSLLLVLTLNAPALGGKVIIKRSPPPAKVIPKPTPRATPSAAPKANPAVTPAARPPAAHPTVNPAPHPTVNPATHLPSVSVPAPSPPNSPSPPPSPPSPPKPPLFPSPPPPPPQGHAPPGSPQFLQMNSSAVPVGYRLALVNDAIIMKPQIMAAILNGSSGVALGDGWIYSRLNERDYIFSEINPLLEHGPFMYTTLPYPSGSTYLVVYGNGSIPYGYRMATCNDARLFLDKFEGWQPAGVAQACQVSDGFAYAPTATVGSGYMCGPPPTGLDISKCGLYVMSVALGCEYVTGYTYFPNLDVNGSSFDPQYKLVGNNSGIASVCSHRVHCKAFNTSGNLKNELPPYSQLIPTAVNKTCQGLYAPTLRAGCNVAGYSFYWSWDSPGIFGTAATIISGPATQVAAACDRDPTCVGFSSKGRLKFLIQDRSQWVQWSTNSCQGLYIKKAAGISV